LIFDPGPGGRATFYTPIQSGLFANQPNEKYGVFPLKSCVWPFLNRSDNTGLWAASEKIDHWPDIFPGGFYVHNSEILDNEFTLFNPLSDLPSPRARVDQGAAPRGFIS
jgi:hypothetical protein